MGHISRRDSPCRERDPKSRLEASSLPSSSMTQGLKFKLHSLGSFIQQPSKWEQSGTSSSGKMTIRGNDTRKALEFTPNSLGFQVFVRAALSVTINDLMCFSRFCNHSELISYTHCLWYLHTVHDIWQRTESGCLVFTKKQLFIAKSLFCPLLCWIWVDTAARHISTEMGVRWPSGLLLGYELSLGFSQSACLMWALPHSLTHPYLTPYSCSNCCSTQQHPIGTIKINSNTLRRWRRLLSPPQSLSGYLSLRPIKYAPVFKWSPGLFSVFWMLYIPIPDVSF